VQIAHEQQAGYGKHNGQTEPLSNSSIPRHSLVLYSWII
jgi:hypothetical protein